MLVKVVTQAVLKEGILNGARNFVYADALAEAANCGGRVAAAAQTAQGRHAGIVPAGDDAFLNKAPEFALAEHGVVDAEPCKLNLTGL